jgi:hypothetical protein
LLSSSTRSIAIVGTSASCGAYVTKGHMKNSSEV